MNDQIVKAEQERKSAEALAVQSGTAKDSALDAKREAESKRDKAIAELELAEKRLKERKPEIDAQIQESEQRLKTLKAEANRLKSSAEPKKADTEEPIKEGGVE